MKLLRAYIRRISPASLGLTLGILYGAVGLLFSVFSAIGIITRNISGSGTVTISQSIGMLLMQPVTATLAGLVSGFLLAWIYNFVARFSKGLLVDFSEASRYEE